MTFGSCTCGVPLPSTGANVRLAQVVIVNQLELALVLFHSAISTATGTVPYTLV